MIGFALLAAAHVAASTRFDLVCAGRQRVIDPGGSLQVVAGEAFSATYAIDTAAKLSWLVGSGEVPFQLTILPGRYVITTEPLEIIERGDGSWIKTQPYVTGVCHKAAYTPMPKPAL